MGTRLNVWSNASSWTQLAPLLRQSLYMPCHCQQLLTSLLHFPAPENAAAKLPPTQRQQSRAVCSADPANQEWGDAGHIPSLLGREHVTQPWPPVWPHVLQQHRCVLVHQWGSS